MMMDAKDRELYDEKIRHLDERVSRIESGEVDCKREIFPRLISLELWRASSMASSWKGAFVIGACSMVGATVAVIISYLLRFPR